MKFRFLAMALVVLLFIPALVFAESETETPLQFSFRGEITWGMSLENVKALEPGEAYGDSLDQVEVLRYGQVEVSDYFAALNYVFQSDGLVSAFYYFDEYTLHDYFYLVSAVSSKYGEPLATDEARQTVLFQLLGIEDEYTGRLTNWELADGTYIALFSTDEQEEEFVLMYFDEESLLQRNKVYNTVGL